MDKELEEAIKILNIASGKEKGVHVYQDTLNKAIETVSNYIKNSISKEKVEEKIEELYKQREEADKEEKIGTGIVITGGIKYLEELLEGK